MNSFVLIVVTYLAGATWGPTLSMQEFKSEKACREAEATVHKLVDDMNKTNILGGAPRRDIIKSECKAAQ